jgi:hypothetical protein
MKTNLSPAVWLALLLGLSGCATQSQLTQVGAFSAAATAYATEARDAFTQINDLSVERQLSEVALKAHPLEDGVFTGVLDTDDRLRLRLQALTALGAYATALNNLATTGYREGIDQSSTALFGALMTTRDDLQKLTGKGAGLSDADLGFIATAVKALGGAATEALRAEAIKSIVVRVDPAIQALCAALAADFHGSVDSFKTMTDSIFTDQFVAFRRAAPNLGYDASLTRLHALRAANLGRTHAADFLEELSQASLALARAHAAVRDSFIQTNHDPAELVKNIGQLKAYADDIKAFNASLRNLKS